VRDLAGPERSSELVRTDNGTRHRGTGHRGTGHSE
jgi:hypothetical protein